MFGNLFGSSKKSQPASGAPAPAAEDIFEFSDAPTAAPKRRRVNLAKRFTIIAETGQGSMSKVYKAVDNESGRAVCLKVQDAAKTAAAHERSSKESYRPSEGEIGLRFNHPNVVKTFDYGDTTKGDYYIAMEFIDGVSLTYVRQSRPFDLASRLELLAQAAEGLAAVHAAGYIHHDFGPKNLLVNRDERLKLIDFGLAVPNTSAFRRPGNRTGTLNYMAPELLRREPTDERIDIFSWGATAFEFLTGQMPYDAGGSVLEQMRHRMNAEPKDIAKANPRLPADVCNLIRKTLARRKEDRWPKIATMADALRELPVTSR